MSDKTDKSTAFTLEYSQNVGLKKKINKRTLLELLTCYK